MESVEGGVVVEKLGVFVDGSDGEGIGDIADVDWGYVWGARVIGHRGGGVEG